MRSITLLFLLSAILTTSRTAAQTGLRFDGLDDRVTASGVALNTIDQGDFTVEAWIKGDEAMQPLHWPILSNRTSGSSGFMFFLHGLWGGSQYRMLAIQLSGQNYVIPNNGGFNGSLLDGTCHHVAIVRDGSMLHFYADGKPFATVALIIVPAIASGTAELNIGYDDVDHSSFNGVISQVRLWNIARTSYEIDATHGITLPGDTPGLVGSWGLNEGADQYAMDATGTANGTLGLSTDTFTDDPAWSVDGCRVSTVGIAENTRTLIASAYPTPSASRVTVELDGFHQQVHMDLFDLTGRRVQALEGRGVQRVEVDLGPLPAGVYALHTTADGLRSVVLLERR